MDAPLDPRPSGLDRDAFVARFGGIYEHSPWVAEAVWDEGLSAADDKATTLAARLAAAVYAATPEAQLALVRAHPDLVGRAAIAGELTASSASEQAGAGLDRCSPAEFQRFQRLNEAYRARFGFPFVIAVAGRDRAAILDAFESRLGNDRDTELATALAEIDRIARLRLGVRDSP